MLMKRLTALLACVCILASFAATSVSAAATTSPAYPSWVTSGTPWGGNLPEYSVAPAGVTNWGGLTAKAAKGQDGNCLRITYNGGGNWLFLSYLAYPGNVFAEDTEYVASFDYLRGPYEYYWPNNIGLKIAIGGVEHRLTAFEGTDWKQWTNYSWEFTAKTATSPTITLENNHGDLYIDNLIVKEKATGNVVYSFNFDMLPTSHGNWGYNPKRYAETTLVPFYNWPTNANVGVIERGTGYAAYVRNAGVEDVNDNGEIFWSSSDLTAKMRNLAVSTDSYTVSYDYIACDGNGWPNLYVANSIDWREYSVWTPVTTNSNNGVWQTYTNTVTGAQLASGTFGFKFLKGCRICVDNLKVTDSQGNVVVEETFDLVPAWNGPNEYFVDEIAVAQTGSDIEASVDVTNSYYDTRSATLITAIYEGSELLDVDITTTDVVGDPTEVNAVTTISHEMDVTDYKGMTFSAFLWDSLAGMKPLTGAQSVTIE